PPKVFRSPGHHPITETAPSPRPPRVIRMDGNSDGRRSSAMPLHSPKRLRASRLAALACLGVLPALAPRVLAQAPQVDVELPPGAPDSRGRLGPTLGASGTSGFDVLQSAQQSTFFGGRPGPSVTRTPLNQLAGQAPSPPVPRARFKPVVLEPAPLPVYG